MQSFTSKARFDRCGAVRCGLAAALLFFILYSAPHRVHHAFEAGPLARSPAAQATATADQHGDEHDHQPNSSKATDCAAQLAAQNTHFASPPLNVATFLAIACMRSDPPQSLTTLSFNPSPCSQRAPPLV
jgi:hypothetical protein